jgi:hypothetical protein
VWNEIGEHSSLNFHFPINLFWHKIIGFKLELKNKIAISFKVVISKQNELQRSHEELSK